ncbi:MAG: hypothetical protein HKO58_02545 [Gammaproteobacteria bacterium]|nr:hypothetical protein [Gammaproteobacteria bacterium]
MTNTVTLELNSIPSVLKMYPKMMLSRKPGRLKEGASYPRLEASIHGVRPDRSHVNDFAKVSGFPEDRDFLPLPYPHVLAAPLHYALLTHQAFPLKLLGLVHISNSITQHRPIGLEEELSIACHIQDYDDTIRGQVFHLHTHMQVGDELVWEETTSFIARKKTPKNKRSNKSPKKIQAVEKSDAQIISWEVPGNMGRKFAKVSGDINPIHLTNITAKLFGFKQAIIHGVWSMSRTLAELEPQLLKRQTGLNKLRFDVNFKLPVFIPSWVMLETHDNNDGLEFVMKDSAGVKPHMSGQIEYL